MASKVWLTYAWADNEEGDFDYLVQELGRAGITAIYDRIAIVPGRRLWAQIADNISNEEIAAWAYLITPDSLSSAACQEELAYALQRALETRGEEYPLEIRPRFGELRYWRLAFPRNGPQPVNWGIGAANGGGIAGVRMESIEGEFNAGGTSMKFVGTRGPLSPSTSAYAVFESEIPDKVFFGTAQEPFGTDVHGIMVSLRQ